MGMTIPASQLAQPLTVRNRTLEPKKTIKMQNSNQSNLKSMTKLLSFSGIS
jgi:hypothetical protein